ncbi:MAG TPA: hypothetical protein VFO65_12435, partial [Acidimicrobiales bacterium]|nr:hypothetical protein [Acidimicrobiales bacterium]
PGADPGVLDPVARTSAALQASVPAAWLADLGVQVVIVPGTLSLSNIDGTLKIGLVAATGGWGTLRFVVVHEWAHQVAFHYGSQAHAGAPPDGFPYAGDHAQEVWADCVARGLTGVSLGTDGLYPECGADLAAWARAWLGDGPAGRARTR